MQKGVTTSEGIRIDDKSGIFREFNGVKVFESTFLQPRESTPSYICFLELNGNVYAANLIKAGDVIGGVYSPVLFPGEAGYVLEFGLARQVRLNSAAHASIKKALMF